MSNFEVHWLAVSYLVSGVTDTGHLWSAVLLTPLTTGQGCHSHCPPTVSDDHWVFEQSLHIWIRRVADTTHLRSVSSLTLPITGQQCHCGIMLDWGRIRHWIIRSVCPDPVKMLRICHPSGRHQWHPWPVVSGVIDTAHQWSVVSLTLPTSG
jgi:hypothetical protein